MELRASAGITAQSQRASPSCQESWVLHRPSDDWWGPIRPADHQHPGQSCITPPPAGPQAAQHTMVHLQQLHIFHMQFLSDCRRCVPLLVYSQSFWWRHGSISDYFCWLLLLNSSVEVFLQITAPFHWFLLGKALYTMGFVSAVLIDFFLKDSSEVTDSLIMSFVCIHSLILIKKMLQ